MRLKSLLAVLLLSVVSPVAGQSVDPDAKKEIDANRSAVEALQDRLETLELRVQALEDSDEPDEPTDPSGRKLIDADVLREHFVGKWGVENVRGEGHDKRRMGFSDAVHYRDSEGFYHVTSHVRDLLGVGLFERPKTLSKSDDPADVPIGRHVGWDEVPRFGNIPDMSGTRMKGLLPRDGGVQATFRAYYAVTGANFPSQGFYSGDKLSGLYRLTGEPHEGLPGLYHHNQAGGPLAYPPGRINADYLLANTIGPGNSTSGSGGPALYAVNFDPTKKAGEYQQARALLSYPFHDKTKWCKEFNRLTRIGGVAWIETDRFEGVLFSIRQGTGTDEDGEFLQWYGDGEHTKDGVTYTDPAGGNRGWHSNDYAQQVLVYDPQDIEKVLSGEWEPWRPQPVHVIEMGEFGLGRNRASSITLFYQDGVLSVGMGGGYPEGHYESTPLFAEFELGE